MYFFPLKSIACSCYVDTHPLRTARYRLQTETTPTKRSSNTLSVRPNLQAAHKIENRQHLISEAKKAYAQKLVADKAGGAKEGEPLFWLLEARVLD